MTLDRRKALLQMNLVKVHDVAQQDEITDEDVRYLLGGLELSGDFTLLTEHYVRHDIIPEYMATVITRQASMAEVERMILDSNIPLRFRPAFIVLVLKNYSRQAANLVMWVKNMTRDEKSDIISSIPMQGVYGMTIVRLMKNDPDFVELALRIWGNNREVIMAIAESTQPRCLQVLGELCDPWGEHSSVIPILLGNPYTPDELLESAESSNDIDDIRMHLNTMKERISGYTPSERVMLARRGNRLARSILSTYSEQLVNAAILDNPYVTEEELRRLTEGDRSPVLSDMATRHKRWANVMKKPDDKDES